MSKLLFDSPWWLPGSMAMIGIVLFISGNKRVNQRMRSAGLIVLGLTAVLLLVSFMVDTDEEKCIRKSRQLVKAVAARDTQTVTSLLDPRASVQNYFHGAAKIAEVAKIATDIFHVNGITILGLQSKQTDTVITIDLDVLISLKDDRPARSNWQFIWQEDAEGWTLMTIIPLAAEGRDPDFILRRLPVTP